MIGETYDSVRVRERVRVRGRRGFALVELTTALFVITVGVFGVIHMYLLSIEETKTLNEYRIAQTAIENEIETLRSLPFDVLAPVDAGAFVTGAPELERLLNATATVHIADAEGVEGLREVAVEVRWTGPHGRTITKRITTLIARKP